MGRSVDRPAHRAARARWFTRGAVAMAVTLVVVTASAQQGAEAAIALAAAPGQVGLAAIPAEPGPRAISALPSWALPTVSRPAGPTHARVRTNSYGKFELIWSRVSGATTYRVIVATDRAMKNVVYRSGHRSVRTHWVSGSRIKEGERYYYQIRSFRGSLAGGKSTVRSVVTLVKPVKKPENVRVAPLAPTSVRVTWSAAKYATGYTVRLAERKGGAPFFSKRTTTTSMTVSNIDVANRGHDFFVTVVADRKKMTFRASDTIAAATAPPPIDGSPMFQTRVASYNVMSYSVQSSAHPWAGRKRTVGANLADMHIVGVQEATWGTMPDGRRQVDDVARYSGLTLDLPGGSPCSTGSVHILYDATVYKSTGRCGVVELPRRTGVTDTKQRYLVWQVLRHRATGQDVFVANTHLSNGATGADDRYRSAQSASIVQMLPELNPEGLPAILLGDLNSFHGRADATPMSRLLDAGYLAGDLFPATISNAVYASSHGYRPTPKNGLRIDHVFVSRDTAVDKFTVRLPSSGVTAGSDHHPVIAIVTVHG